MQHDVAATLRFDINSHWLVKLEGHYMTGTAASPRAERQHAAQPRSPETGASSS